MVLLTQWIEQEGDAATVKRLRNLLLRAELWGQQIGAALQNPVRYLSVFEGFMSFATWDLGVAIFCCEWGQRYSLHVKLMTGCKMQ